MVVSGCQFPKLCEFSGITTQVVLLKNILKVAGECTLAYIRQNQDRTFLPSSHGQASISDAHFYRLTTSFLGRGR